MGTEEHRKHALSRLKLGILTLSTTRTLADDASGAWIAETATKLGHEVVCHEVAPDRREIISAAVTRIVEGLTPHALLLTGGTGISPLDVTIEAVRPLFDKELTAFGSLFARLSYEEIGPAAILSRAAAGIIRQTAVFSMPGSLKACRLACEKLIFPEIGHLAAHIRNG